jgi:hypothetical protein
MSDDICPHCNLAFRIVRVRFGLTGARLVSTCPNCALAHADSLLQVTAAPEPPWPPEHSSTAERLAFGISPGKQRPARTGVAEAGPGAP